MDTATKEPKSPAVEPSEQGYQLTIGRDTIRVVSVFSGTRTASEAIHEAAVKKNPLRHKQLKFVCNIVRSSRLSA